VNADRSDPVHAAAEVIVANHVRVDSLKCLCGFGQIGKSHALHVVQELAAAGLLVDELAPDSVLRDDAPGRLGFTRPVARRREGPS
jgi:hypothetical protein